MSGPVLIDIPATDFIYTKAAMGLLQLMPNLPPGSGITFKDNSSSVAGKHNALVEDLLAHPQFERLWIIGSDMVVPPDAPKYLLNHEAAIVGAFFRWTRPPHHVDAGKVTNLSDDPLRPTDREECTFGPLPPNPPPNAPPVEVDVIGSGCTVYDRRVFESIQRPWFVANDQTCDGQNCDWNLSVRAGFAGFLSFCDPRVQPQHLGVRPC